ncbi:MAG: alpha/beta fold hydrolase [Pseudomonadota bacterium]
MKVFDFRFLGGLVAVAAIALAVWQLESVRAGLTITHTLVGTTPVTITHREGTAPAPVIVIAHGFAGSRQMMAAYALTLARAGYVAVSFDFKGHGRNAVPMSGDLERIEGTTQLLVSETAEIIDAALALPVADGRVAVLGHSMASDIIIRQAIADPRVKATVAISAFSKATTSDAPANLLLIAGEWEGGLRDEALRALRLVSTDAVEGRTVGTPSVSDGDAGGRRFVSAPSVEHVGILYSATALREARAWLDQVFGRTSDGPVAATGGWVALLMGGLVFLAWPLTRLLPRSGEPVAEIPARVFFAAALIPAIVTPLVLSLFDTRILPVLVADYLAMHLLVYGALSIAILRWGGIPIGRVAWVSGIALAVFGIFVFGGALDRYVASFMPTDARLPIIAAIAVGAVPYMLADALLSQAGAAPWYRGLMARGAFLASLIGAVMLDFERLFFLLIIIPVIVLFFVIFGLMGGWVGRWTRSPFAVGLGLGLVLAWALGVSFPLFISTA